LAHISEVFDKYTRSQRFMNKQTVRRAVSELTHEDETDNRPAEISEELQAIVDLYPGPVDFDTFVALTDQIRKHVSQEMRKRAGFTEAEVDSFQQLFIEQDMAELGTLSFNQVTKLLLALDMPMRDMAEREEVLRYLARARAICTRSGYCRKGETNFWCVVQLLRLLYRRKDKLSMDRLRGAEAECKFTVKEVAEFQEIFMTWWERTATEQPAEATKMMGKVSLEKLLRSRGLKLDKRHKEDLGRRVDELSDQGLVDFPDFLRLMRWVVDTNFADVTNLADSGRR